MRVEIETEALSVPILPKEWQMRIDLMEHLYGQGMSYKDIATFLNTRGIKTPTGKEYYAHLINNTLYKYRKRLKRLQHKSVKVSLIKTGK